MTGSRSELGIACNDWLGGGLEVGTTYEVRFPFVREVVNLFDEEGPYQDETWRPGVRHEPCAPDDFEAVADGEGQMLMHVVDIHKPGRYPPRVFFTRRWRDPDGREFGRTCLRVMTEQTFKRRLRGYMHDYKTPNSKLSRVAAGETNHE